SLSEPKALMLGYRRDVERLYRLFDVFVLNSFAEGMSNTLLEAMASRRPVICTAVGGNGEIVLHQNTGLLVEAGDTRGLVDAIVRYLRFPSDRSEYACNARRFVLENFSIQHMIDQYTALYDTVT